MTKKNVIRRSSFTLIELLVVIGIIGILVGILLPAISSAIKEGKKTKAESDCKLIAMACAGYKNDYQTLPGGSSENNAAISTAIFDRIGGKTGRKKVYFENTGTLLNPWDNQFFIVFDDDYDGDIAPSIESSDVAGAVGVWTEVPGGTYVKSWE